MIGRGVGRGVGATVVAALGALVFASGCSSDTGGTGSGTAALPGGSGSAPAVSTSSSSAPPTSIPVGGGSASKSAFCTDWTGIGSPDVSQSGDYAALIAKLEKAASDAPAQIKDDMNTVVSVFKGIASHDVDMSKLPSDYEPAIEHIISYVSTNCV